MDSYSSAVLPTTLPLANTEYIVFATVKAGDSAASRKANQARKRAILSVYTDQPVTIFHRHLSAQAALTDANDPAGKWRNVPDDAGSYTGTLTVASQLELLSCRFFGDDHALVIKTGPTPPTVVELSLRFSNDQAVGE